MISSFSAHYWGEDVTTFRPSRFIDTDNYRWPRDAFLPFAAGARACIGRQSALVEATAFLARIVAKYKIEVPADKATEWKLRPGESEVDRRERIYKVRGWGRATTHARVAGGSKLLTVG